MSFVEKALAKMREAPAARTEPVLAAPGSVPLKPAASPPPIEIEPIRKTLPVGMTELQSSGHLPPPVEQRRVSYEFRRVKRPLLAAAVGAQAVADGRLLMVASALPGEGKSFTSVNLALSMALEKDFNVLLVDADLAKAQVTSVFGATAEPGLIEGLQDGTLDVESLVMHTGVPNLDFLPAGKYVESATELLASERMRTVCKRLAEANKRRIVVFDSPPLLLTNESRVLTEVVGQIVVVVRAGHTARAAVFEALESIPEHKHVSAILNQSRASSAEGYYGYGYGEYGKPSAS